MMESREKLVCDIAEMSRPLVRSISDCFKEQQAKATAELRKAYKEDL